MLVECDYCQATVDGAIEARWSDEDPEAPFDIDYFCLKCPRCTSPILVSVTPDGTPEGSVDRLYPLERRLNPSIPKPIRAAYEEAVSCLRTRAYTASTIMCRKTLEAICKEHGATANNLLSSLKTLKESGVIEHRLYDWADALRIAGNEAAHDVSVQVSANDAKDLLEFTNALLEYIFTFRDKFEQFKRRRAKRDQ